MIKLIIGIIMIVIIVNCHLNIDNDYIKIIILTRNVIPGFQWDVVVTRITSQSHKKLLDIFLAFDCDSPTFGIFKEVRTINAFLVTVHWTLVLVIS